MKLFSIFSSYVDKLSKIMKNKGTERERDLQEFQLPFFERGPVHIEVS